MSRRSNPFTVAVLDLPSWADYTALPNSRFIEFTLNTPHDVGMQRSTFYNWCGGDFVPDFGARGGVCYVGGGEHSPWTDSSVSGNGQQGVYVLDCDTRLYSRKCYPVVNHTGVSGTGSPTNLWGAYADDGSPQSKHTYNCVSYMPTAWGGGASGSLVTVAQSGGARSIAEVPPNGASGYSATWRFDLSKANHSVADPSIYRHTGDSLYNFGSGPGATINDAPFSCIDTTRQGWWATHRAGAGWGGKMVFTSKAGVISAPIGGAGFDNYVSLRHFPDDDIVVALTDGQLANNIETEWKVFVWQANTNTNFTQATLTRQSISDFRAPPNNIVKAYVQLGETQPRWSSLLGAFVWLDSQYPTGGQPTTTIRVWKLTPPPAGQRFTGTWTATYELVTAKPGTESTNFMNMLNGNVGGDAGVTNSCFGRFVECPSLRAFVWSRDINKPGQLVRLQGM